MSTIAPPPDFELSDDRMSAPAEKHYIVRSYKKMTQRLRRTFAPPQKRESMGTRPASRRAPRPGEGSFMTDISSQSRS